MKTLQAALAVIEHSQPGFESHRQQLHWPRLTAQIHAAALLQLTALAISLCNSADRLSHEADSTVTRVTRLPALIRRLCNRCSRDPLEKDSHRSWWETIVALCKTAQNKGKRWPDSHDVAIQEVADGCEHPNWHLSSRTSDTSETVPRARLRNTPDLTGSSRWLGITSPKQEST